MTPDRMQKRYIPPTNRELLCEIMQDKNLNRAQVARICGFSNSAVERWVDGSRTLSNERLAEIKGALAANQNVKANSKPAAPAPAAIKKRIDIDVCFHIRKTMGERLSDIGRGIYVGIRGLVNHALIPIVLPGFIFGKAADLTDGAIASVAPDAWLLRIGVFLMFMFTTCSMSLFLYKKASE